MYQHSITGVPEREKKRQKRAKNTEQILALNFPNLVKNINLPTQRAWWTTNRISSKRSKIETNLKDKEKILNIAIEKLNRFSKLKLIVDF